MTIPDAERLTEAERQAVRDCIASHYRVPDCQGWVRAGTCDSWASVRFAFLGAAAVLSALPAPATDAGAGMEVAAWDWLHSTPGDHPHDQDYCADQMVEAFIAGAEFQASALRTQAAEIERLRALHVQRAEKIAQLTDELVQQSAELASAKAECDRLAGEMVWRDGSTAPEFTYVQIIPKGQHIYRWYARLCEDEKTGEREWLDTAGDVICAEYEVAYWAPALPPPTITTQDEAALAAQEKPL